MTVRSFLSGTVPIRIKGQERDSSSDEQGDIIEDDDMEDSPTDTPELWIPERYEEDTKFERASADVIPTKRHPQSLSQFRN
jgi:hypothetical protein